MVPRHFIRMESWPRGHTGKIDRAALQSSLSSGMWPADALVMDQVPDSLGQVVLRGRYAEAELMALCNIRCLLGFFMIHVDPRNLRASFLAIAAEPHGWQRFIRVAIPEAHQHSIVLFFFA